MLLIERFCLADDIFAQGETPGKHSADKIFSLKYYCIWRVKSRIGNAEASLRAGREQVSAQTKKPVEKIFRNSKNCSGFSKILYLLIGGTILGTTFILKIKKA